MMFTCDARVVVGYDRKKTRLGNTAINRKYDNYSCHRERYSHISKHTTYQSSVKSITYANLNRSIVA